jgi:hypothetical protein
MQKRLKTIPEINCTSDFQLTDFDPGEVCYFKSVVPLPVAPSKYISVEYGNQPCSFTGEILRVVLEQKKKGIYTDGFVVLSHPETKLNGSTQLTAFSFPVPVFLKCFSSSQFPQRLREEGRRLASKWCTENSQKGKSPRSRPFSSISLAKSKWQSAFGEESSEIVLQLTTFMFTSKTSQMEKPPICKPENIRVEIKLKSTRNYGGKVDGPSEPVYDHFVFFACQLNEFIFFLASPELLSFIGKLDKIGEKMVYDSGNGEEGKPRAYSEYRTSSELTDGGEEEDEEEEEERYRDGREEENEMEEEENGNPYSMQVGGEEEEEMEERRVQQLANGIFSSNQTTAVKDPGCSKEHNRGGHNSTLELAKKAEEIRHQLYANSYIGKKEILPTKLNRTAVKGNKKSQPSLPGMNSSEYLLQFPALANN